MGVAVGGAGEGVTVEVRVIVTPTLEAVEVAALDTVVAAVALGVAALDMVAAEVALGVAGAVMAEAVDTDTESREDKNGNSVLHDVYTYYLITGVNLLSF